MIDAASPYPQYSGNFIPEAWAGMILIKFYDATCLTEISNSDYSGDVKSVGDVVNIRTRPTVTNSRYYKGQSLSHQHPDSDLVQLRVDYARYFDFEVDDIDAYQTDINILTDWAEDASENMQVDIEKTDVFSTIYADADTYNAGATAGRISGDINLGVTGTPLAITKTNILEVLVDCRTVLNENNAPRNNRWAVLPAWMCGMIMKSDLKDASLAGDGTSIMRNGRLGTIAEFTIYDSNTLYSVTDTYTCYHALVGQKKAMTFVSQMTKMQHLKTPESTFGQIIRGLNVYGFKVLKDECLIDLYIYNGETNA